ncbi:MAG: hypothetical protein K9G76_10650 [Bacteroidales bacterium]|nr:hypothetical protein [Bacteroidales bacterium]MCF8404228.1 hypothetical protein [Bacteroidales bacterium]
MKRGFFIILLISTFLIRCTKDEDVPQSQSEFDIFTGTVSGITNTTAKVTGIVMNLNGNSLINHGHVWSTNSAPEITNSAKTALGVTEEDIEFTSLLTGLEKSTTYYVRAYTTDASGTYYGEEKSFMTGDEFFKFKIGSDYIKNNAFEENRLWIMIYTSDNTLVGIQEAQNNSVLVFDWPKGMNTGGYNVQIFRKTIYLEYSWPQMYYLSNYMDVIPETWNLGLPNEETINPVGSNIVALNNINLDDYDYTELRNKYDWGVYNSVENSVTFDQYFNPDNIYIMFYNFGEAPFYKWIDNVGLNESFSIGSSEFIQMSDFVNFSFGNGTSDLAYIESEDDPATDIWEYYMVYYNTENNLPAVQAYYPGNLFNGYYSYFRATKDNDSYVYCRRNGSIPSQFNYLQANLSVIDDNPENFAATINGNPDYVRLSWEYVYDDGHAYVFSYVNFASPENSSNISLPNLPEEIAQLKPEVLQINNLYLKETAFGLYDNFSGFDGYISNNFILPGNLFSECHEYFLKYVQADEKSMKPHSEEIHQLKNLRKAANPDI